MDRGVVGCVVVGQELACSWGALKQVPIANVVEVSFTTDKGILDSRGLPFMTWRNKPFTRSLLIGEFLTTGAFGTAKAGLQVEIGC
jgi:hypothetical protein